MREPGGHISMEVSTVVDDWDFIFNKMEILVLILQKSSYHIKSTIKHNWANSFDEGFTSLAAADAI